MKCKLANICDFAKQKIDVASLDISNYISTENMMPNKAGIADAATLPNVVQTQSFEKGDTLVSNIRPYFKKIWYASFEGGCSNDVLVFRAKTNVNPRFLYYVLADDIFFEYATSTAKGTKMPRGDKKAILEYEVPDISYKEQEKIANVLSALDDKIALNQQINKNLEEQAQAIFDNALLQSNSISYATLGSLADVKGGKRLPKGTNLITKPNSHPYIRVRDLNHVIFASLSKDYEYVDDETQKSISRYITSAGDVLISIVGTIGLTAIVDKTLDNANLTENCVRITNLKKITSEYLLLYLRSVAGIEYITKGTVGAVQLKLPIKNIQTIPVPLLSKNEIQSLCSLLPAIFDQIEANIAESKRLIDIRDALLPRLMSGEIDVSKVEI